MEENQRKGPGVFYAVVGVATLVVAIIGATFAYFSASVTPGNGSDTITGQTQNINGSDLTLTVNKVVFADAVAAYPTLVPAYFGSTSNTLNVADPTALTSTQVGTMLSNNCEKDGFTGCHVYRITISATQDIAHANLLLDLELTGTPNTNAKDQWGYVVFQATETPDSGDSTKTASFSAITLNAASHGNSDKIYNTTATVAQGHNASTHYVDDMDLHSNAGLTVTTSNNTTTSNPVTYYLLVYVNDTDTAQNVEGDNYVVGGYSGALELQALDGKVRATFESVAAPANNG